MTRAVKYEDDLVAWAAEQASLLRERRCNQLDIEHLADEIEDVGKSEQRELAGRMVRLLVHLLKWQKQLEGRGAGWRVTIRNQRRGIARRLAETPSLQSDLADADWWAGVWNDATAHAAEETGLADFPDTCPWDPEDILNQDWLPQ